MDRVWARGWRFNPKDHPPMGFGRFGSLADAIYAIVATILVLELHIPEHLEPGHVGDALAELGPDYVVYALGTAFVLVGWVQSRRVDRIVLGLDHYSTLLQISTVFVFALTPFLAKVLTRGLHHSEDLEVGVRLTAAVLTFTMILWAASFIYFKTRGYFRSGLDPDVFNRFYGLSIFYWVPPVVAFAVSYVSASAALVFLLVLFLVPLIGTAEPPPTPTTFKPSRRVLPERGWVLGGWKFAPRDQGLYNFERLGTLVDGVYAIVTTLIVLELHLPDNVAPGELGHALSEIAPQYVAYGLGLVFAFGGWLQARRAALWLRGVDHYATLFILGAVCTYILTPFVATVLAQSFDHPADLASAVRLTAAIQFITLAWWCGLLVYAARRDLFLEGLDPEVFTLYRWIVNRYWVLPVAAWFLSYVAPWVAFGFVVAYFAGVLLPQEAHPAEPGESEQESELAATS